ncbi:hypothetical protein BBOMB_1447 [Bifidobacterium bombi DSM 19703]|uniref:Uncharacterized protein n=1 Tax=Bifidobacterium bombi DSM 19703 TaxID=1341695 RepID=A0A086BNS2_9BIFI|nr:hypothetical protein BBOMB_1447 [Bifidobacterium bombi DSM 19703]
MRVDASRHGGTYGRVEKIRRYMYSYLLLTTDRWLGFSPKFGSPSQHRLRKCPKGLMRIMFALPVCRAFFIALIVTECETGLAGRGGACCMNVRRGTRFLFLRHSDFRST